MRATFSLVAIDCPDPVALAHFYGALTGLAVAPLGGPPESVEWVELDNHGAPTLAFQRVGALPAPTWPEGPQPQRLHLDFSVDDLDAGEAAALALGATRADHQPGTTFRVFFDPIGHPFCLVLTGATGD
ncbi:MAG TPA: VOC family protein [Acidimicrobiales bacterium]|nr:MAG: hypothetical protein B7Z69_00595 [Actinobacteria bacterium 21-73-9]HQU25911.1 VOC family protein [Acidimicrobiales bacterium]